MAADRLLGGIGTGVDAFAMVYPSYALSGIESAPHSHSLYLEALIEWGLPGLICLLLMLFLFFQSGFTHLAAPSEPSEASTRHITAAGISAVAGFMIMGLTDYVWYNYRIFAFFWMLVALVSAARRSANAERTVCIPDDNYVACGQKESKS